MIDATIVRAHQHRAGAQKKAGAQAISRSRGGLTTKIHALVDALGNPVEVMLSPGQDHDLTCAEPLIEAVDPGALIADKAFDADTFIAALNDLGACLLNPGEMGFEPLKPVGEPGAANSRIRFDVRVEALRPSFVAPFPRWRSSARCECGQGRGPPLGELQDIVGGADKAPLVGDLLDAAQEKLTEAARLLDLSEHRLGQLLS
jgi:Transposase DDE domain